MYIYTYIWYCSCVFSEVVVHRLYIFIYNLVIIYDYTCMISWSSKDFRWSSTIWTTYLHTASMYTAIIMLWNLWRPMQWQVLKNPISRSKIKKALVPFYRLTTLLYACYVYDKVSEIIKWVLISPGSTKTKCC